MCLGFAADTYTCSAFAEEFAAILALVGFNNVEVFGSITLVCAHAANSTKALGISEFPSDDGYVLAPIRLARFHPRSGPVAVVVDVHDRQPDVGTTSLQMVAFSKVLLPAPVVPNNGM